MEPDRTTLGSTGELEGQISTRFVQLFKEFSGIGPNRCRTYVDEDLVTVVLGGGYTRAEGTLFEDGKWLDVRTSRHSFQDTMEGRLTVELEALTGRQVRAFMSASHQSPDLQVELFVLEPIRESAQDVPSVA
jgi:uncharacterized protein YbcI